LSIKRAARDKERPCRRQRRHHHVARRPRVEQPQIADEAHAHGAAGPQGAHPPNNRGPLDEQHAGRDPATCVGHRGGGADDADVVDDGAVGRAEVDAVGEGAVDDERQARELQLRGLHAQGVTVAARGGEAGGDQHLGDDVRVAAPRDIEAPVQRGRLTRRAGARPRHTRRDRAQRCRAGAVVVVVAVDADEAAAAFVDGLVVVAAGVAEAVAGDLRRTGPHMRIRVDAVEARGARRGEAVDAVAVVVGAERDLARRGHRPHHLEGADHDAAADVADVVVEAVDDEVVDADVDVDADHADEFAAAFAVEHDLVRRAGAAEAQLEEVRVGHWLVGHEVHAHRGAHEGRRRRSHGHPHRRAQDHLGARRDRGGCGVDEEGGEVGADVADSVAHAGDDGVDAFVEDGGVDDAGDGAADEGVVVDEDFDVDVGGGDDVGADHGAAVDDDADVAQVVGRHGAQARDAERDLDGGRGAIDDQRRRPRRHEQPLGGVAHDVDEVDGLDGIDALGQALDVEDSKRPRRRRRVAVVVGHELV
jgi:hypothetical protein